MVGRQLVRGPNGVKTNNCSYTFKFEVKIFPCVFRSDDDAHLCEANLDFKLFFFL